MPYGLLLKKHNRVSGDTTENRMINSDIIEDVLAEVKIALNSDFQVLKIINYNEQKAKPSCKSGNDDWLKPTYVRPE